MYTHTHTHTHTQRLLLLFSCLVVSKSLWLHGPQHSRLPCPSLSSRVCSDSSQLSRWCHPTNSCSDATFSSCPQSSPASGFFLMSQFFTSGGQSIKASALALVLPVNIQGWFPLGLTDVIFLQSKGLLILFQYHSSKASILLCSAFFMVQLSHLYMTTGKTIALTIQTFISKVMSLLFNTLSRFVMAFLPRKWKVKFAQSCLTLCDPWTIQSNRILQARILEWVAIPFSRVSSQMRDGAQVSCQEASIFWFHGCSHCPQWFWSPRK